MAEEDKAKEGLLVERKKEYEEQLLQMAEL